MSALVNYAVGAKAESNAWESLVRETVADIANAPDHVASEMASYVKGCMKAREDLYKIDFPEDGIPTSYRTAKSVVLKSIENEVALLSPDGTVKGKTAIEKENKAKAEPKEEKDLMDKWHKFIDDYHKCGDDVLKSEVADAIRRFLT